MAAESELERFCGFAERFLTDEQDRPLVIEPFQRQILTDYFAGARETIVLLSKKNGKTSLFAGLAVWHVVTVPFADVAILAASRDQAGKLLQQLSGYIKRSDELRKMLRVTQRVVHCDRTNGKVAVQAADSDTLDGWGGTLALVDELARHKSEENFGLLRDGLGPLERDRTRRRAVARTPGTRRFPRRAAGTSTTRTPAGMAGGRRWVV